MSITVSDAPERERFEARDADAEQALAGFMTYQLTGNIIVITHTRVDDAYEGKGVAGTLARFAMDDARARGRTVVPICPFLAAWLPKHPEYGDLVVTATKKVK